MTTTTVFIYLCKDASIRISYLDFVPVTRSHGLILQIGDQRHGPLELVHAVLTGLNHLPVLVLNPGQQPKQLDILSLSLIILTLQTDISLSDQHSLSFLFNSVPPSTFIN